MSDTVIRVEGLGKRYRIGKRERYRALRDVLAESVTAPLRWLRGSVNGSAKSEPEEIWALKDVSFEVKRGDVVGIIGRNGAGKSTLLKILSRITDPTEGRIEITGRVSSLLEVGTGFHTELTGRDNIYLNGAILGMRKAEIDRKFDEIVAFAGVERFIDTPVKHYSSGMQLRLGFSVAAHLETEVIIVDEVLAVGDAEFQRRCLGRIEAVGHEGRTVIFVTHQLNQIRRLCQRCFWLDDGMLKSAGPVGTTIASYETSFRELSSTSSERSDGEVRGACFQSWSIIDPKSPDPHELSSPGPVEFEFFVRLRQPIREGCHGIHLLGSDGQVLWGTGVYGMRLESGDHRFRLRLRNLPLAPGTYCWLTTLYDEARQLDFWYAMPEFRISTPPLGHPVDRWAGLLNLEWTFASDSVASAVEIDPSPPAQ